MKSRFPPAPTFTLQMSATTLRAVKLLSEITEDYFYFEDLIEKLGMNKATESKTLKNAREQVCVMYILCIDRMCCNNNVCL